MVRGSKAKLSTPDANFQIRTNQLLDHLEAMMIHAFEPALNGQEGRFGKSVISYKQVCDERLGPEITATVALGPELEDFGCEWKTTSIE